MGNGEEPGTFSSARANRMVGFFDFVFILFPCNCMHENAPFIRKRRRNGHPEILQLGNEALNEAEEMNHRASGVFRRCLIPE
ncbi:hypothetical protein GXP70_02510 [Paenibacillus lycopersici]|uniref:Uncharacterized protein n=1 Tax=Paenibacillus lycopersici TaxID=2704462 RepID=A0A6C0FU07_9BACL|nr:hypothetical protein [Paenibacillus lycopersici]QHT58941.1 hypothetical protein GXP70_02510 [Paenibacillus lycopersici]